MLSSRQNALFYLASSHPRELGRLAGARWMLRRVQMMALIVRAVEAVNFIRWLLALWHFGADAGGPGDGTTCFDMARPCHLLPACPAGVGDAPVYSSTWSQSCAHDRPMSWLNHLEHRLGMLKPPPVVLTDRALELLWLDRAHYSTLRWWLDSLQWPWRPPTADQTWLLAHRRRAYHQARLWTVNDRSQAT